ncbi:MAG: hypothetical protein CTY20_05020 [Hyphomicrobium sp.]|nr:MAG: hypothetical protein CTY20_05020 [Hyphomicrobium sp.]
MGWIQAAVSTVAVLVLGIATPVAHAALEGTVATEQLEVDVSSRSVAVTSGFNGTELVVFGSVANSRQDSPESGYYDVVIVVEGVMSPVVVRRKSSVGGLWINTASIRFGSLPSYYAIASTRPIDEIADADARNLHRIGFSHVPMQVASRGFSSGLSQSELMAFQESVVRLKRKDGLYVSEDYSVAFIGRSLFRAAIGLPANIPVGPVTARVYLFRSGEMLSMADVRVALTRQGLDRYLHTMSKSQPLLYGLLCVALAVGAGMLGSTLFRKASH